MLLTRRHFFRTASKQAACLPLAFATCPKKGGAALSLPIYPCSQPVDSLWLQVTWKRGRRRGKKPLTLHCNFAPALEATPSHRSCSPCLHPETASICLKKFALSRSSRLVRSLHSSIYSPPYNAPLVLPPISLYMSIDSISLSSPLFPLDPCILCNPNKAPIAISPPLLLFLHIVSVGR